jgi:hypothetical protein
MVKSIIEHYILWQDEADVWQGRHVGDRHRWMGRFNLAEIIKLTRQS